MKKILIVDSDEQITGVIGLKLRKENFEVKTHFSTSKALEILKEFKPDLIISEMVLPELTGVDFLKRVKMNPETMNTPFIFLSNSRNVEDKIIAHEMGAEAFFMKPIFIKVLINRIKDFFDEKNFKEMISSKDTKSFSGDLTSVSVIDILNIISENSSSGEVLISSSTSEQAKIFFNKGSVVRIETGKGGSPNGVEELFNLLSWLDGSFKINYKEVSVVRNINIPHDRLVMRAVSWFEDYSGELSEMPPTDSFVYVDFGQLINNINKFPDRVSEIFKNIGIEGSSISSIIEKTVFDRRQTVKYLKKMMEAGVISLEKKQTQYNIPPKPAWLAESENNDDDVPPLKYIDLSNDEETSEKDKTLVPPPAFARKDTLDPAMEIKFDFGTEEEKMESSININIEILRDEPVEDKTEIIKSVHNVDTNGEPIENMGEFISDLYDKKNKNPALKGASVIKWIAFLVLLLAVSAAYVYLYHFDKIKELLAEKTLHISQVVVEPENEKNETKEDLVLTEEQKKMAANSVSDLILMSADYYEKENLPAAIETNKVALYKLKIEKIAKGTEYEKVMTNMAIFLYADGKYEEALEFAEESILLRDDVKGVELKAAILQELKRPAAAASLLRTKLNDEQFSHKKEEWMMEINRLENITQ